MEGRNRLHPRTSERLGASSAVKIFECTIFLESCKLFKSREEVIGLQAEKPNALFVYNVGFGGLEKNTIWF